MNFLLAPNAMKGSLTAQQIAVIVQKSLRRKHPSSVIDPLPIADGGNGTLTCLMNALGGTVFEKKVPGPVSQTTVTARYGITPGNIAIIESAEAVGLHYSTPAPDTIAQSTSRGLGEIILEAMKHNPKEVWIGLGGSGTNDGGAGMGLGLGIQLLDENAEPLKEGAVNLLRLHSFSAADWNAKRVPIKALVDVKNVLLGENGATYTYARQKGASDDQLPYLEAALKNFADVVETHCGKRYRHIPGAGAAGGLGFGLMALCGADIVMGADFILETVQFDSHIQRCDHIITAEGMIDEQTLFGKGIAGICQRARKFNKPVHAFVGTINGDPQRLQHELGLASLTQISPPDISSAQAMRDASWLLADAVYHHSL